MSEPRFIATCRAAVLAQEPQRFDALTVDLTTAAAVVAIWAHFNGTERRAFAALIDARGPLVGAVTAYRCLERLAAI